jgi:hypothetical protein
MDTKELEKQATLNGQRNFVSLEQLRDWLGSYNPDYEYRLEELVLDIVNDIYHPKDVIRDMERSG